MEVPVNRNKNSVALNNVNNNGAKKVVPKSALRPATYLLDNYPSSHASSFKSAIGLVKPPYQTQPYNHHNHQSALPCGPHLPNGHVFGPQQYNRASHLPCCPCCSGAPTPCSLPSCQQSVATYQIVRPPPPCCMQLPICCLRLRKFLPIFAISKPLTLKLNCPAVLESLSPAAQCNQFAANQLM